MSVGTELTAPKRPIELVKMRASVPIRDQAAAWPYQAGVPYHADMGDWRPFNRSPDGEINFDNDRIRARNRDLVRNDGWATGSISRIADGMVGSTFYPVPEPNWRALAAAGGFAFDTVWAAEFRSAVMSEWRMWANDPLFYCDASRSQNMTQIFYLGARHKLLDGEALALPLWLPERKGYGAARYATSVKLVDPDRLSNPNVTMDSHNMRGGVELDQFQAPCAYHIRRAHPNDVYDSAASMIWDRFERQTSWGRPLVVHDFDRDRAEQHRANGILTPVLARFKALAQYDQVALQAAIMRTLVAFFVKSPMDVEQLAAAMGTAPGDTEMQLSAFQSMRHSLGDDAFVGGARIPKLGPGDDIVTAKAGGEADDFKTFEHTFLRSIAAATGESAEEITKDYTATNYSSARAALLSVWRTMLRRRSNFATGFCTPIYAAWLEEAIDEGLVPLPAGAPDYVSMRAAYARAQWIGPGRGWIDPVKERQGEVLGLDAGFGTLNQTCSEISGMYWEDVLDQREIEEAAMKKRGLTLPNWAAGGEAASLIDEKPKPQ